MLELLRALLMASPTMLRPVDAVAACRNMGLTLTPQEIYALLGEAEAAGLAQVSGVPDAELQAGEIAVTSVQAELTAAGRAKVESGYGGHL
jgi:hypothetical protein